MALGLSRMELRKLWGKWWSIGKQRGPDGNNRHCRCKGAGLCTYAPCWQGFELFWSSLGLRGSPWRMIPGKVAYLALLR